MSEKIVLEGKSKKDKVSKKKKRNHIILFTIEILALLVIIGVFLLIDKGTKVQKYDIKKEDIIMNDKIEEIESLKGYKNIALFGVDSRGGKLGKGTLSDTIMIASINEDTHEVRLVSIYRDTYLNVGNNVYNKANTAYAKGGPQQAINMLNMNFDLNITDYVTVGFEGIIEAVDSLGGVEIDILENEIDWVNGYQASMFMDEGDGSEELNVEYTPIEEPGLQKVNGLQAMAFCRIRHVGNNDFRRTERQRIVIMAISERAKILNIGKLNDIADGVFPLVATSLDLKEILDFLSNASKYTIVEQAGFPDLDNLWTGNISVGSSIVPTNLEENVILLHEFLFEESNYKVTPQIKEYDKNIKEKTAKYMN